MFKNQSGQVNLMAIIGWGLTVAMVSIGGYFTQSYRTDTKIDTVKTDIGSVSERTAKLEEAIQTLKTDNAEIKRDVKQILLKLK